MESYSTVQYTRVEGWYLASPDSSRAHENRFRTFQNFHKLTPDAPRPPPAHVLRVPVRGLRRQDRRLPCVQGTSTVDDRWRKSSSLLDCCVNEDIPSVISFMTGKILRFAFVVSLHLIRSTYVIWRKKNTICRNLNLSCKKKVCVVL